MSVHFMALRMTLAAAVCLAASYAALADTVRVVSVRESKSALGTIRKDRAIDAFLAEIAKRAVGKVSKEGFNQKDLAISLIIQKPNQPPVIGGFNDKLPFYPASVIKIPYAMALEQQFQDGRLMPDRTTLNDLHDMLRRSSNAATNRILDKLTQTESGPELSEDELRVFSEKRQAVNRYLRSLGFEHTNAVQKTWDDWPFGRDLQFIGKDWSNRNRMTTDETARMVWLIRNEKVISPQACRRILQSMKRTPGNPGDIQSGRIGSGIPPTSALWSKAGWTDETNHDAAWVDLPIGGSFVLVIFTNTGWEERDVIRFIAQEVSSGMQLNKIQRKQGLAEPGRLLVKPVVTR